MSANGTSFEFIGAARAAPPAELLLVPLPAKPPPPLEVVTRADALCQGAISELLAVRALGDEPGQLAHTTRAGTYRRVLLLGLGDAGQLNLANLRKAAAAAANWLAAAKLTEVALWIDGLPADLEQAAGEWAAGMAVAGFRFAQYRRAEPPAPGRIRVHACSSEAGRVRRVMPEIGEHLTIAAAVNYTRALAHQPGNVLHPESFAAEARRLSREGSGRESGSGRLRCTVLAAAQLKRLGMGGLLAVGSGAAQGPCLVQLEYRGAPRIRRNTVLVGKAVTFDTGGYSIKPAAGLEALKFDKTGGATVLGVLKAAAALGLKCNVTGLVAAAENAISDRAYRPGDILTLMSGKTVEVISTDAEGRLMLADALWYAQEKLRPTELIDVATLTGGVGVALGQVAAGLMSNSDDLAGELGECGRRTGERLWRLPLWDEYRELIKGTDADLQNSTGKRDAHAIVGGMFLREFVRPGMAWAHLDIAAVANSDNHKVPTGKGATGFGVRLLLEYLRRPVS